MANTRLSMRKIREDLASLLGQAACRRDRRPEAAVSAGPPSRSTWTGRRRRSLSWPLPEDLDDASLENRLFPSSIPLDSGKTEHALLRLYPHGAHEKACDPPAPLGGIQGEQPRRLPVQPVLPQIPGMARRPSTSPFARTTRRERSSSSTTPATPSRSTIPRQEQSPPPIFLSPPWGRATIPTRRPSSPGAPFLDQTPRPYVRVHGRCVPRSWSRTISRQA